MKAIVSEFLGTMFLLVAVVGSGIMGERLAGGNVAIALLANAIATGAALIALISTFGPVSGAHFNPAVTISDAVDGGVRWKSVPGYIGAQVGGAFAGVLIAHLMFQEPMFAWSNHARGGVPFAFSEVIATIGLLAIVRGKSPAVAVGAYITGAYWFTASTSFANPAVTLARAATDTFAGIRPGDVPGFLAAQSLGTAIALLLFRWLLPRQ